MLNYRGSDSVCLIVMATLEHDKSLGQRNAILRCGEINEEIHVSTSS